MPGQRRLGGALRTHTSTHARTHTHHTALLIALLPPHCRRPHPPVQVDVEVQPAPVADHVEQRAAREGHVVPVASRDVEAAAAGESTRGERESRPGRVRVRRRRQGDVPTSCEAAAAASTSGTAAAAGSSTCRSGAGGASPRQQVAVALGRGQRVVPVELFFKVGRPPRGGHADGDVYRGRACRGGRAFDGLIGVRTCGLAAHVFALRACVCFAGRPRPPLLPLPLPLPRPLVPSHNSPAMVEWSTWVHRTPLSAFRIVTFRTHMCDACRASIALKPRSVRCGPTSEWLRAGAGTRGRARSRQAVGRAVGQTAQQGEAQRSAAPSAILLSEPAQRARRLT